VESSKVYHISPSYLRNLKIELNVPDRIGAVHDRENAYEGTVRAHLTREQKETKYDTLKESIRHKGFNEEFPIIIKLMDGEDEILQGHHRLNIAIELELPTVPVRFTIHERTQ